MKLLLKEPNATDGGGGNIQAPAALPPQSLGIQQEIAQSKGPATTLLPEKPVPDSVKGKTFNLDSDDTMLGYEDNKDATPKSDQTIQGEELIKKAQQKKEAKKQEIEQQKEEQKSEPKPEQKPEEKKGLKIKTAEEVLKAQQQQQKPPAQQQQKPDAQPRDYSIFPEDKHEILKQTSNDAFKFVSEIFTEKKKLEAEHITTKAQVEKIEKGGLPFSYYDHPEAWRLHPSVQQKENHLSLLEAEEGHYREQINKINAGEAFRAITGWKNGEPIYGPEIPASEQAKTELLLMLGNYAAAKRQSYSQLNAMQQYYRQEQQNLLTGINKVMTENLPWITDDKHEKQAAAKELLGLIPPERQGDYLAKLSSYLYSEWQYALGLLEKKQEKQQEIVQEIKEESKNSVEPSVRSPSVNTALRPTNTNGRYAPPAKFDVEGM